MDTDKGGKMLAPLVTGDRIPYKLNAHGQPTWLTVTEAHEDGSYTVRYPDGHTETLTDSR